VIRAILSVAFLLLAGTSLAQKFSDTPANACPVEFTANVSGRAIAHTVNDGGKGRGPGQLLEIGFGRGVEKIEHLTVVVHGADKAKGAVPIHSRPIDNDIESFRLTRDSKTGMFSNSEIWVTKLGAVAWTEITEIGYADGSVWRVAEDARCIAKPSLLKLVNATAY
jgi:hypothetical protein